MGNAHGKALFVGDAHKLFKLLENKGITLPENISQILQNCKKLLVFNSTSELAIAACDGENNVEFEVKYDIPGKGEYTEAIVHRVRNGISANYTEAYMRRRDPDTMVISDKLPTDKQRFSDKYGYDFFPIAQQIF